MPVENFSIVKSKLYIFELREVRTIYFVESELYIDENREVRTIYFVKSELYILQNLKSWSQNYIFCGVRTTYLWVLFKFYFNNCKIWPIKSEYNNILGQWLTGDKGKRANM